MEYPHPPSSSIKNNKKGLQIVIQSLIIKYEDNIYLFRFELHASISTSKLHHLRRKNIESYCYFHIFRNHKLPGWCDVSTFDIFIFDKIQINQTEMFQYKLKSFFWMQNPLEGSWRCKWSMKKISAPIYTLHPSNLYLVGEKN